jgi:Fe-S cluster assembly ATP-binding protein
MRRLEERMNMASVDLLVKGLRVGIQGKEILRGIDLSLRRGEIHALLGPNGSGKSTLAYVLMGHPAYEVVAGEIRLFGEDIRGLDPDERARRGLFLAFQYPAEVPGVALSNFLRTALSAIREQPLPPLQFYKTLHQRLESLGMDPGFADRAVNEGFSGGEKKRSEILQMSLLQPKIAILDEIDSGLDIDALRVVANEVRRMADEGVGILVITHYQRILEYLKPDLAHVMIQGRIVRSGGPDLVRELEAAGYDAFRTEAVEAVA